ncbi:hypothetical protein Fcan01_22360 [Folsomia candida]|uniref:Uncharacterized protein n=1 Tax=Folsomia candida TaxID=158441 RepID=A0A226DBI9_FOLCA|nr:hypothetical protein Fcan01_22360 [Folsomia candida]
MKTKSSSSRVSRRFSDNPFAKNIVEEIDDEDLLMDYERFDENADKLSKSSMSTPMPPSGRDKPHKKLKKNKEVRQEDEWGEISTNNYSTFGADKSSRADLSSSKKNKKIQEEDEWETSNNNNSTFGADKRRGLSPSKKSREIRQQDEDEWETSNNYNNGFGADKRRQIGLSPSKKSREIRQEPEEDEWGEISTNNNINFGANKRRNVDLSPSKKNKEIRQQQQEEDEWEETSYNKNTSFGTDKRSRVDLSPPKKKNKEKRLQHQEDEWETNNSHNNSSFGADKSRRVDLSSSKKKNKERRQQDSAQDWETNNYNYNTSFGANKRREVDLSQVPPHLFKNMVQATPPKYFSLTEDEINHEDVEGWIIQCPRNVNLKEILEGKKLSLKDGASSILSSSHQEEELASIPLHGCITVRTHLEEVYPPEVLIPRKKTRKLPRGIKQRHPIYGVDFSEALSGDKVTKTRSTFYAPSPTKTNLEDDFIEKLTFSKTKRVRKSSVSIPQVIPEPEVEVEPPSKKLKKRKSYIEPEEFAQPEVLEEAPPPSKKSKSSKKRNSYIEPEILEIPEYYVSPKKEKKTRK